MAVDIKAEFQVEKVTGTFKRTITNLEETHTKRMIGGVERILTTRKMVPVEDVFTEAYMIYFPQGHSMLVAADDEEQLMRIGVLRDPKLVDMESGEDVPEGFSLSPKEIVERKQRNRPRNSTQGGIAAALGD